MTSPEVPSFPVVRAIVSDPVEAGTAGLSAVHPFGSPASAAGSDVVYVAFPPGAAPEASEVAVWNRAYGLLETIAITDGGFDPVAVRATDGDTLDFVLWRGANWITWWPEIVPASSSPVVVRSNPARGKRDVPVALSPLIVFSEPMDAGALDVQSIQLFRDGNAAVPGRVEVSSDLLSVVFTPDEALVPNTAYVLSVGPQARDLDGEGLGGTGQVAFTTEYVWSPPTPCASAPFCGRIVFSSARDGNAEIYAVNADGTDLVRLTNDPASDLMPSWSPDGQRIAFVSHRDGSPEIYVMNADASNVVQRTFSASYSQNPTWSPDGTSIAYSRLSSGSANLWVVSPDPGGPGETPLFEAPGWDDHPDWSPDGRRLAFASDWNFYDGVQDVFLIDDDGSGRTDLTGGWYRPDFLHPSWSPNGARLAVTISEEVDIDQYVTHIGVMDSNGAGLTALVPAATWASSTWSPDGQMIAFNLGASPSYDIAWVSADGGASGILVSNGWDPDWRP